MNTLLMKVPQQIVVPNLLSKTVKDQRKEKRKRRTEQKQLPPIFNVKVTVFSELSSIHVLRLVHFLPSLDPPTHSPSPNINQATWV